MSSLIRSFLTQTCTIRRQQAGGRDSGGLPIPDMSDDSTSEPCREMRETGREAVVGEIHNTTIFFLPTADILHQDEVVLEGNTWSVDWVDSMVAGASQWKRAQCRWISA